VGKSQISKPSIGIYLYVQEHAHQRNLNQGIHKSVFTSIYK